MQKLLKILLPIIYVIALFPRIEYGFSFNSVVAYITLLIWAGYIIKIFYKSKQLSVSFKEFFFLLIIFGLKIINCMCINSYTIGLILFVSGMTIISGFYTEHKTRLYWLGFLTIALLPIQEYVQIFLGTPLRFISAEVISKVLTVINISNYSQSSIIFIENNLTNIDYPCSGNSTIGMIFIFVSIIGFCLKTRFTLKTFFILFTSVIVFVLLNMFRMFFLILMNYFNISETVIKILHPSFGLMNFAIIFLCLYYAFSKIKSSEVTKSKHHKGLIPVILLMGIVLLFVKPLFTKDLPKCNNSLIKIDSGLGLTEKEANFFRNHNAIVDKKLLKEDVLKMTVTTESWTSHHNPENCIKGSGMKIIASETIPVKNGFARSVKTDKGYVYYYFTDGKIKTDDYYKRAFVSIFGGAKNWTLVEFFSKEPLKIE